VLAWRAWRKHGRLREAAVFAAIVAVVGTMVLWPALLGTRLWAGEGGQYTFLQPTLRRAALFAYHLVEFWGHFLGLAVIAIAWGFGRRKERPAGAKRPGWFAPHLTIIVLYVLLFWLHSDKCEYFLPALPSALFLLGRTLSRRGWQVIALAFLINGLVTLRLGHWPRSGVEFFSAPRLEAGAVLMDDSLRHAEGRRIAALWQELQEPGAVVTVPGLRVMEALNVCCRLTRGPSSQLMFDGPVVPGMVHRPIDGQGPRIDIWPTRRTGDRKTRWPILLQPETGAVAVDRMCPLSLDRIGPAVREAYRRHQSSGTH
jgi:hypothetical protein